MSVKAIIIILGLLQQLGSVLGCSDPQCQTLLMDVRGLKEETKEAIEGLKETIQLLLIQNQHMATELASMKQETAAKLAKTTTELATMKQELMTIKQEAREITTELMTIKQEARENFKKIDINYINSSQCHPQTLQQLQTIESNTQTVLETLDMLSRTNTSGYPILTQQCPPRWPIDNTTVSVPIQNIAQTCDDIARRNPNSPQGYYQLANRKGSTTIVRCPEQHRNPCSEIAQNFPYSLSGYYEVQNSTGRVVRVYCDMNRTFTKTGPLRGWMSVANLNMNDSNQNCPEGLSVRANPSSCGKSRFDGCDSAIFPVHGVWYRRVCGKMIGYQKGQAYAFWYYSTYRNSGQWSLDRDHYVDGATLTHGRPNNRTHIWTFAVSDAEDKPAFGNYNYLCPCAKTTVNSNVYEPPFIGGDYFCDTGARTGGNQETYYEDPLWDGHGCGPTSSCCTLNSPPYFCKDLAQPTTDDIELRLCKYNGNQYGDILIEQIELYVS